MERGRERDAHGGRDIQRGTAGESDRQEREEGKQMQRERKRKKGRGEANRGRE